MRVFVLNTGRCGSMTVSKACGHLTNYTSGHESRGQYVGDARFAYPDQHIEVDNRLSWFLGGLERRFGDDPLYVHLRRDPDAVTASFERRFGRGIMAAFNGALVYRRKPPEQAPEVARFYVDAVTENIEAFLQGKPRQMTVWLEDAETWFPELWDRIAGEGDLGGALREFQVQHNAS